VLWFWCEARAGGCQRTLAVYPSRASVVAGARLVVTVRAYDNDGRSVPASGATVWLGGASARSDSRGRASVTVPRKAGGYWLAAGRPGSVPAFPGWIAVR
jgi:hypothetical protein